VELMTQKSIAPFWRMLPVFAKAVFSFSGQLQLLAIAVFIYAMSWVPFYGAFVAFATLVGYVLHVVIKAGHGAVRLPPPEDIVDFWELRQPLQRLVAATAPVWLPVGALFYYGIFEWSQGRLAADAIGSHLPIVVWIGFSALYLPGAIIAAAFNKEAGLMTIFLYPIVVARLVWGIMGEYLAAVVMTWGLWAVDLTLVEHVATSLRLLAVPVFGHIAADLIQLYIPVFAAMVLGRLVYQNAERFGVDDQQSVLLPDAVPTGSYTPPGTTKREP
jgi:hypothetical protein